MMKSNRFRKIGSKNYKKFRSTRNRTKKRQKKNNRLLNNNKIRNIRGERIVQIFVLFSYFAEELVK